MDYKGRIYQLVCDDGYYYIGSTKNELRKRFWHHKHDAKTEPDRKVYQHINRIGWNNVKIVLIEEFCCKNKEELVKKEYEYIQLKRMDRFCLNTCLYNDITQYNEDNKDAIKEYKGQWYESNKNKINEKVQCECGSIVSKQHMARHRTSNKHIKLMNNKP